MHSCIHKHTYIATRVETGSGHSTYLGLTDHFFLRSLGSLGQMNETQITSLPCWLILLKTATLIESKIQSRFLWSDYSYVQGSYHCQY